MLKFKVIKNTIINHKPKNSNIQQSIHPQELSPLSFKTITKQQEHSPLRKGSQPYMNYTKFQTDKKQNVSPFRQENYKSDAKENEYKNIYYAKPSTNFSDLSFKKIEFAGQTKRKIHQKQQKNLYTENPLERKNSKGTLSFANLIHSKTPYSNSKCKFNAQSQRKQDRQSSISKLKEKLFGMKRIISEKENSKPIERPSLKKLQTYRDILLSPYKLQVSEQDMVKVSMREDNLTQELDMAPYLC